MRRQGNFFVQGLPIRAAYTFVYGQPQKQLFQRLLLWLFLLMWAPLSVTAQQSCAHVLAGIVVDKEGTEPLPSAIVSVVGTSQKTVTGPDGTFRLTGLCAGKVQIEVRYMGYTPSLSVWEVPAGGALTIAIESEVSVLAPVEVEAHPEELMAEHYAAILGKEDLLRKAGDNLGSMLTGLTGVYAFQSGPGIAKPVVHGLHSNRLQILNNGLRQESQSWGSEHAPEIDPYLATQLTVIKGAAAVRYGPGAIGGVILVQPEALRPGQPLSGSVQLTGATNGRGGSVSGMLQGGAGHWKSMAWRVQGSARRFGDAHAPAYQLTNTGLQELNFSAAARIAHEKQAVEVFYSHFSTELGILRAAHIGNLTDLRNALTSPVPLFTEPFSYQINNPRQRIAHHLLKIQGSQELGGVGKLSFLYGFQANDRKEFDIRRGGRSDRPSLDMLLTSHLFESVLDFERKNGWVNQIGADGLLQFNQNVPGTGIRPLVPNFSMGGGGLFASSRKVWKKWEVEGGSRIDYRQMEAKRFDRAGNLQQEQFRFANWNMMMGGSYFPHERLTFTLQLSNAWRPPHAAELFSEGLHHGAAAIEEGDISLQPEKAWKVNASVRWQTSRLHIEATAYQHWFDGFIYLRPDSVPRLTIRGAFPVFRYTQTDARMHGLDVLARWQAAKDLSVSGTASFIRAWDRSAQDFLIFIPADRLTAELAYQPEGFPGSPSFTAGGMYVARQYRTPDGVDYAPAPEGYWLAHTGVQTEWQVGGRKLTASLNIENLLNQRYRDYLNRFRYFADERGRNIVLRLHYAF